MMSGKVLTMAILMAVDFLGVKISMPTFLNSDSGFEMDFISRPKAQVPMMSVEKRAVRSLTSTTWSWYVSSR